MKNWSNLVTRQRLDAVAGAIQRLCLLVVIAVELLFFIPGEAVDEIVYLFLEWRLVDVSLLFLAASFCRRYLRQSKWYFLSALLVVIWFYLLRGVHLRREGINQDPGAFVCAYLLCLPFAAAANDAEKGPEADSPGRADGKNSDKTEVVWDMQEFRTAEELSKANTFDIKDLDTTLCPFAVKTADYRLIAGISEISYRDVEYDQVVYRMAKNSRLVADNYRKNEDQIYDISGVYEDWKTSVDCGNGWILKDNVLAIKTDGTYSYSIWSSMSMTESEWKTLLESVK